MVLGGGNTGYGSRIISKIHITYDLPRESHELSSARLLPGIERRLKRYRWAMEKPKKEKNQKRGTLLVDSAKKMN